MKNLKYFLLLIAVSFNLNAIGEGDNAKKQAKTIVDKKKSVEENLTNCNSLIKSHCGEKSNQECMKQASPKSAQVAMCMSYMMKNPMKGMDKGLHASFKSLYSKMNNKKSDLNVCFKKAKVVCGEEATVEACLLSNPGVFPSFCRSLMEDSMDQMNAVYQSDPEMAGCTDSLIVQCPLDLSNENDSKKESLKKIQAYQDCLSKKVKQTASCKGVVNSQVENAKNGKSTQLIQ